jgi:hypothetical protein
LQVTNTVLPQALLVPPGINPAASCIAVAARVVSLHTREI